MFNIAVVELDLIFVEPKLLFYCVDLIFGEICNCVIEIPRSDLVYLDLHLFSVIISDLKLGHRFE